MRHSPVTHSKLNKIYFLPILGVIIVYGGKMLSVERLYLRESRFKYGRLLAKFPLKFSICFNKAAVPAECCQIERNSSQDKRLTRPTEDNSRVSVHKNINYQLLPKIALQNSWPHCQCLRFPLSEQVWWSRSNTRYWLLFPVMRMAERARVSQANWRA